MKNELVKSENGALAMMTEADKQAASQNILQSDIVIPKILLMQALSDFVVEKKAESGQFIRSTTLEKMGDDQTPLSFIPLAYTNVWTIREKVGNKYEFRRTEPMTARNADLPWDYKENGTDWKRIKTINAFGLMPKDIEAEQTEMAKAKQGEMPDPEKALLPVAITFRSTSYKAGQAVATHFARAARYNLQGYVSILNLSCYHEKNDQGAFYVMEVKPGGKTPEGYFEACEYWRRVIGGNTGFKLDESDEQKTEIVGNDKF